MRLAIIGCGALGSLFAAALSSQTVLVMLGHWPQQIAHVRSFGLALIDPDGNRSNHKFRVIDDPSQTSSIDLALVLVKSYQTGQAALEINQILADDGLAVSLQNGLGNVELLAAVLGSDRVTQGITALGATMQGPGVVRFAGHGPTHLAQGAEGHRGLEALWSMMNAAGLETYLTGNLESLAWGKLAINSGINPLTALLQVPNGYLAANEQARNLMCAAAEETCEVAKALHIDLPYPDASRRVLEVALATAKNRSSMLQDVVRGFQTEIDAISGEVVRNGELTGINTPINAEFLRLIQLLPTLRPSEKLISTLEPLQSLLCAHSTL